MSRTVTTRHHLLAVLPGMLVNAALFYLFILIFLELYFRAAPDSPWVQLLMQSLAFIFGMRFILDFIRWRVNVIRINPRSIVVRNGLIFSRSETISLVGVRVSCTQNLLDHSLDRGSVRIHLIDGEVYDVGKLANFAQVRATLQQP